MHVGGYHGRMTEWWCWLIEGMNVLRVWMVVRWERLARGSIGEGFCDKVKLVYTGEDGTDGSESVCEVVEV